MNYSFKNIIKYLKKHKPKDVFIVLTGASSVFWRIHIYNTSIRDIDRCSLTYNKKYDYITLNLFRDYIPKVQWLLELFNHEPFVCIDREGDVGYIKLRFKDER